MTVISQTALVFLISFGLTLISSYLGDDDVVYKFFNRKPTGKEAIVRICFVMVKYFASISGGCLISAFVGLVILKRIFFLNMTKDHAVLLTLFFIIVAYLLIGVIQNVIRRMQGRQPRSIFDWAIYKHNIKLWLRPED